MGDQIGKVVEGTLYYIDKFQFDELLDKKIDIKIKAELFSKFCRLNTLYMIAKAGSGHIGSSFSSLDIFSWLYLNELKFNKNLHLEDGDIFFSSKGHDAPGFYSVLCGLGHLDFKYIDELRKLGGLPGHPDIKTNGIATNTGSLGMGISKAKGMIFSRRLRNIKGRVFVLTGDGELQEGQFWESLQSAANHKMDELFVIVDHNKLQSDTFVSHVSDLGDLESKIKSFNWNVLQCDGNDFNSLKGAISNLNKLSGPKLLIANTIKGKGVSFMEHTNLKSDSEYYQFHSGAPNQDDYLKASQEIINNINECIKKNNLEKISISSKKINKTIVNNENHEKLIEKYSKELLKHAKNNNEIIALDADLVLDTGLIPFKEKYPSRFIECGIAEQDMVSIAGGLALNKFLPIVHSFACFLSTRPNEQIYNNSTEKKKIIYIGSLAGILPGGPGHSHQSVRDISLFSSIPGMTVVEPCNEDEVALLLDWAININPNSTYIRLCSIPWNVPIEIPKYHKSSLGKGLVVNEGEKIALICYGPIGVKLAHDTAEKIKETHGFFVKIIVFPWLNNVKHKWLSNEISDIDYIIVIDNHYKTGGLGDVISKSVVSSRQHRPKVDVIGLEDIPLCGENDLVLKHAGLDTFTIIYMIEKYLHDIK